MAKEEQQPIPRQGGGYPYNPFNPSCAKLAKVVRDAGGDVPKSVIARELSMAETGSGFAQLVASSKCYGVVDGVRTLSLTDAGHEYFYPTTPEGERTAMLSFFAGPPAFKFVIDNFDGKPVPAQSHLANLLHRKQGVPKSWASRTAAYFYGMANELGVIDDKRFLRYAAAVHTNRVATRDAAPGVASASLPEVPAGGPEPAGPRVEAMGSGPAVWANVPARPKANVWTYNEAGGIVKLETPDPLPRALWDRLTKYVKMLEPADASFADVDPRDL